jgi:hypothetical protein
VSARFYGKQRTRQTWHLDLKIWICFGLFGMTRRNRVELR